MKNTLRYSLIVGYVIVVAVFLFRVGHRVLFVVFPEGFLPIHIFAKEEGLMVTVSMFVQALLFGVAASRLRTHVSVYLFAYVQALLTIAALLLHWAHGDHSYWAHWLRNGWAMSYLLIGLGACFTSSDWPLGIRTYGISRLISCLVMFLLYFPIVQEYNKSEIFRVCIHWLIPLFDMVWLWMVHRKSSKL